MSSWPSASRSANSSGMANCTLWFGVRNRSRHSSQSSTAKTTPLFAARIASNNASPGLTRLARESSPGERRWMGLGQGLAQQPHGGGLSQSFRQQVADRAIEQGGRDWYEARIAHRQRENCFPECLAALFPSRTQRGHRLGGQLAEGLEQPTVQLSLGEQAGQWWHQRPANMEVVVWKLEVEERGLGLLELARDGKHIVRQASRLAEGHVDHYQQVERRERLTHAGAVGQRVSGVGAFDQHGAKPLGMIREDLIGNHVARREPSDQERTRHRSDL